ncbi:hypothetical protein C8Q70DRAFT_177491 [Cubamyces menziesii]|nr:hypothetical protein C8Q70DRAFT_177491 [Cubamyces menziesii]
MAPTSSEMSTHSAYLRTLGIILVLPPSDRGTISSLSRQTDASFVFPCVPIVRPTLVSPRWTYHAELNPIRTANSSARLLGTLWPSWPWVQVSREPHFVHFEATLRLRRARRTVTRPVLRQRVRALPSHEFLLNVTWAGDASQAGHAPIAIGHTVTARTLSMSLPPALKNVYKRACGARSCSASSWHLTSSEFPVSPPLPPGFRRLSVISLRRDPVVHFYITSRFPSIEGSLHAA